MSSTDHLIGTGAQGSLQEGKLPLFDAAVNAQHTAARPAIKATEGKRRNPDSIARTAFEPIGERSYSGATIAGERAARLLKGPCEGSTAYSVPAFLPGIVKASRPLER